MKKTFTFLLALSTLTSSAQYLAKNDQGNNEYSTSYLTQKVSPDFYYDQTDFKKRSPGVAFLLSAVLPGGGQFYNGDNGKGWTMLLTSVTGVVLFLNGTTKVEPDGVVGEDTRNNSGALLGMGMVLVSGVWSIIDAPIRAAILNKQNKVSMQLEPGLFRLPNDGLKVGPNITLAF